MVNWIYKDTVLLEIPTDAFGFVYEISYEDKFYIGSKQFKSITNPKISKKRANVLYTGKGRKKVRETKTIESKWRTYTSSSKLVNSKIEELGIDNFKFIILSIHNNKTEMLLCEAYHIIQNYLWKEENMVNEWVSVKVSLNQKNTCDRRLL